MTDHEAKGLVGACVDMVGKLTASLPPAFIALLFINMAFLGIVFWFLNEQMDARIVLLNKIIDHCLTKP